MSDLLSETLRDVFRRKLRDALPHAYLENAVHSDGTEYVSPEEIETVVREELNRARADMAAGKPMPRKPV